MKNTFSLKYAIQWELGKNMPKENVRVILSDSSTVTLKPLFNQ